MGLRRVLFFWKIFEFEKEFGEIVRDRCRVIDIILHKNFCIRILYIDDIEYHCTKIFFLFQNFFLNDLFYFYVLRRILVDAYHFLIFFLFFSFICCSAVALNSWIISTTSFFVFVKRFRKRQFFRKNRFINDWIWWLMSRIYFSWMMIINDALSAIKIYDLFKTTLLFYFFHDFLLSSLSTYQDIKNVALERTNTNLYRWTKLFYKLKQSTVDDTIIILIIYCNVLISTRDADICNVDKDFYYEYIYVCQCKLFKKDSRKLPKLVTFNIRILFIFFKFWWVSAKHIQWKFWYLYAISLCIVFARIYYLHNKNELNNKKREKENERKINSIFMLDKQRYLKF